MYNSTLVQVHDPILDLRMKQAHFKACTKLAVTPGSVLLSNYKPVVVPGPRCRKQVVKMEFHRTTQGLLFTYPAMTRECSLKIALTLLIGNLLQSRTQRYSQFKMDPCLLR